MARCVLQSRCKLLVDISHFMRRYSNIYQSHLHGCDNRRNNKRISQTFVKATFLCTFIQLWHTENSCSYFWWKIVCSVSTKPWKALYIAQWIANQTVLLFTVTYVLFETFQELHWMKLRKNRLDFTQWTKIGLRLAPNEQFGDKWKISLRTLGGFLLWKNWTSLCMVKIFLRIFTSHRERYLLKTIVCSQLKRLNWHSLTWQASAPVRISDTEARRSKASFNGLAKNPEPSKAVGWW